MGYLTATLETILGLALKPEHDVFNHAIINRLHLLLLGEEFASSVSAPFFQRVRMDKLPPGGELG